MNTFPNHQKKGLAKRSKVLFAMVTALLIMGNISFGRAATTDETATDSAIPEAEIRENLKDRLEKAVKDIPAQIPVKRAWVGTLESIANHTLTIETRDGPRLASVSAQTTFIRMPKRETLKLSDLELKSYTVAMGYLNGNQVLNALRILIEAETPKPTDRMAQIIKITNYNAKKDMLTGILHSEETITGELTDKTAITKLKAGNVEKATTEILTQGQYAIAIVKRQEKNNQQTITFLHLHLLSNPKDEGATESDLDKEATASQKSESSQSSPSASD